jgi:hypothetical protein
MQIEMLLFRMRLNFIRKLWLNLNDLAKGRVAKIDDSSQVSPWVKGFSVKEVKAASFEVVVIEWLVFDVLDRDCVAFKKAVVDWNPK